MKTISSEVQYDTRQNTLYCIKDGWSMTVNGKIIQVNKGLKLLQGLKSNVAKEIKNMIQSFSDTK